MLYAGFHRKVITISMKHQISIVLLGLLLFTCFAHISKEASIAKNDTNLINQSLGRKMKIKIGVHSFTAILDENKATEALKTQLPLSLNMTELNDNEKYGQLPTNLPTNTENIGTIQEGDILLWGANTLVVFYKTFKTSYSYTKIGRIENPIGLAAAVGSESVTMVFELE
jgi:hypothetical protein